MYIVHVEGLMGRRFDKGDAEEMGRYIMEHVKKGKPVTTHLYV